MPGTGQERPPLTEPMFWKGGREEACQQIVESICLWVLLALRMFCVLDLKCFTLRLQSGGLLRSPPLQECAGALPPFRQAASNVLVIVSFFSG